MTARSRLESVVIFGAISLAACGDNSGAQGGPGSATDSAAETSSHRDVGEVDGVLTATLGGEARTWRVLTMEYGDQRMSQSEWAPLVPDIDQYAVTLFGHAEGRGRSSEEALMVSVTMQQGRPINESITYLDGDLSQAPSSEKGGHADISISHAQIDGDVLTIEGTFSGVLGSGGAAAMANDEPTEPISVEDGAFEARLRPAPE